MLCLTRPLTSPAFRSSLAMPFSRISRSTARNRSSSASRAARRSVVTGGIGFLRCGRRNEDGQRSSDCDRLCVCVPTKTQQNSECQIHDHEVMSQGCTQRVFSRINGCVSQMQCNIELYVIGIHKRVTDERATAIQQQHINDKQHINNAHTHTHSIYIYIL